MADLAALLAAANKTIADMGDISSGIGMQRNSQQDIAEATASAQLAIGANNQIIEGQKNQAALETQNARLKAGAITGTDLNQQGEQISGLVATMNQAYTTKMQAANDIAAKRQVGFMDNPLQHILNLFTINDDIDKYGAANTVQEQAKGHIDELNAIGNATAQNQSNFTQSLTQASITAAADNTKLVATIAADKSRVEGLGYNITGLQEAMQATREQLGIKFQVESAKNTQAQLGLAMQNYALHKQEFEWKKEDREANKESDEFQIERMQKGFEVMYGKNAPTLTASPKLARQYLALLKSNTPAGREATEAYMAGQSGILGGTPAQVTDLLAHNINVAFTPAQEQLRTLFGVATSEVKAALTSGEKVAGMQVTKDTAVDAYNKLVINKVNAMLKDIEPGANNLFNIGSVKDLLGATAVADTPFAQKVLGPAVVSGVKLDDPKQLFSTAIAAVKTGTISPEDAATGITALYQTGVNANLTQRNLPKFGIIPDDNMKSYNTKIQTDPTALLGGTEIVNLTNPASVKRALSKNLAAQTLAAFRMTQAMPMAGRTTP